MPKCPHCKEEINIVNERKTVTEFYECTIRDGKLTNEYYDNTEADHDGYECPECFEDLAFENDDQVADFLNGAI